MRKFLGILLLLLGLTFVFSGIYHIFKSRNDVVALAEETDINSTSTIVYIPDDTYSFVVLSPYSIAYSDMNGGTFILWCYNDVFHLGVTEYETDISNSAELLASFNLNQYIETTHQITGPWIGDTGLMNNEIFITSTFSRYDSDLGDCIRFVPNGYTLDIIINIERFNRNYVITAEGASYDIYFSDDLYRPFFEYTLRTINSTELFQEGFQEGLIQGTTEGYNQGKIDGYNEGYYYGVEVGSNGDLFGSSIIPSINSLFEIEIIPNVSFSTIFSVGFGIILLGLCIKIFLGG